MNSKKESYYIGKFSKTEKKNFPQRLPISSYVDVDDKNNGKNAK